MIPMMIFTTIMIIVIRIMITVITTMIRIVIIIWRNVVYVEAKAFSSSAAETPQPPPHSLTSTKSLDLKFDSI